MTNATIASSARSATRRSSAISSNSLVASGFDYIAFRSGLGPVRQASRIARYNQRGDLVDSVVAATYDPVDGIYGNGNDMAGNGRSPAGSGATSTSASRTASTTPPTPRPWSGVPASSPDA